MLSAKAFKASFTMSGTPRQSSELSSSSSTKEQSMVSISRLERPADLKVKAIFNALAGGYRLMPCVVSDIEMRLAIYKLEVVIERVPLI